MTKKAELEIPNVLSLKPDDPGLKKIQICIEYKAGIKITKISRSYGINRGSVYNIIRSVQQEGIIGLLDKPRSGRPVKFDKDCRREAIILKVKNMWLSCSAIARKLAEKGYPKCSHKTIENFFNFCGLISRHGKGIKKNPPCR